MGYGKLHEVIRGFGAFGGKGANHLALVNPIKWV